MYQYQKIKINVTSEQEKVLWDLSNKCRLIYNFALKERIDAYNNNIKGINYYKQQNDLPKLKEKYPEYKWVYSKVLQMILKTLDTDYKSFFSLVQKGNMGTFNTPNFKGKQYFTTMIYNHDGFKIKNGIAKFSHNHPSKTKLEFKIPNKFKFDKIYQISIYRKNKDYFLSITYDVQEKKYQNNENYQAFDLGLIKQTAVNSNGKFIEFTNKRPDRYWEKPISELQSRRDHCKKYSRKWYKLNNLKIKCTKKSANQLKDFQHKLSHKIVNNTKANIIIVGKLSTKQMCQIPNEKYCKGLHKSLQNTGIIGRFVGFLTYKAKLIGKKVVEIDERGTSKTCCVCGKEKDMPLNNRKYECDCGNNIDRDKNSSVNIMKRYLSTNGLWTAYWQFVNNLRQTGLTIVFHPQETTIKQNVSSQK